MCGLHPFWSGGFESVGFRAPNYWNLGLGTEVSRAWELVGPRAEGFRVSGSRLFKAFSTSAWTPAPGFLA